MALALVPEGRKEHSPGLVPALLSGTWSKEVQWQEQPSLPVLAHHKHLKKITVIKKASNISVCLLLLVY